MKYMEILNNLFAYLGSAAILTAGIAWVMRKLIDHFFDKKAEELKCALEKETLAFHIRYEKLHTERAEVIKNLYGQIADLRNNFYEFTNPVVGYKESTISEMNKAAFKAYKELDLFHKRNKIFLDRQLAEKIDDLLETFVDTGSKVQASQELKAEGKSGDAEQIKAWDIFSKKIPPIMRDIENEFRKIIGVQDT